MNERLPAEPESAAPPVPADAANLTALRRKARRLRRQVNVATILFVLCNPGIVLHLLHHITAPEAAARLCFLFSTAGFILTALYRTKAKRRWRRTVDEMALLVGAEAVGALIEALRVSELKQEAWEMLTVLLPRLKSSDAHLLTPRRHRLLNRVLNGNYLFPRPSRTQLILAAIKAYEQIGGTEDLPTVERLAQGAGYAKRNKDIRAAAQACLPYLRERSEQQNLRQTLLRASTASADEGGTLLRPATSSDDTAPHELLRPAEPGL